MAEAATTFSVIHTFKNDPTDGLARPNGFLAQGRDGNLYGTASWNFSASIIGGAFKISPISTPNGVFTFAKLHTFNPTVEGWSSQSGFSVGTDGNFYGTTTINSISVGVNGPGTIFRMMPTGSVTQTHNFVTAGINAASNNASPPVQGRDGNFYGTTFAGGKNGHGAIYKLTPAGVFSIFYHFDGVHGSRPVAPLVLSGDGNLYGTTRDGGVIPNCVNCSHGTVFKIASSGALTVLHSFDGTNGGGQPLAPLIQGTDGKLYGTTAGLNASHVGLSGIFRISPSGANFEMLHTFNSSTAFADGFDPSPGLILASDGNFYGATTLGGQPGGIGCGVLFKLSLSPTKVYTPLHRFNSSTDGCFTGQSLTLHTNGKIYGSAKFGGSGGAGTIYQLDIGARPFVRPQVLSAKVGDKITLYGDFSGTITGVTFGGVSAIFTRDPSNPNNTLIVTIPVGAKTGSIVVIKATVTITTIKTFNILPTFTSFSPTSGVVGDTVILKGTGLSETTRVTFAANKIAPFTVDNDSQLTVNVPIGAVTGKITISTKGGSAASAANFTVFP
jgi:uncharacterized repeat protein (TIGR03803 family)